jgi:hypothetical protein
VHAWRAGQARQVARDVPPWGRLDTGLPLGTAGLFGLSINQKGTEVIALTCPPLTAIGLKGWTDDIDLMLGVGRDQDLGIDITAVE